MKSNYVTQKMSIEEINKIKLDPTWEKNKEIELKNKSLKPDELCFCGSGKKYQNCCHGKSPIEILENRGFKVKKDELNRVIVGVGESYNIFEGCLKTPRVHPLNVFHYIPINDITDYNSIWEITQTGWDSIGPKILYPYINVDEKWYRWDESYFIRPNCNTHQWDEKNYKKFYPTLTNESLEFRIVSKQNRNEKCNCGSGNKFKNCCGKNFK